jgi:hypothetical protein
MVENFSWVTNKQDNFKEYVSNPDGAGLFFSQLEVPKVNFTNSFGLGVASNNANLIEEIKQTFKL